MKCQPSLRGYEGGEITNMESLKFRMTSLPQPVEQAGAARPSARLGILSLAGSQDRFPVKIITPFLPCVKNL